MSKPIQLIEKPKTRKDWENNKLYYRNKSFSKHQLDIFAKNENLVKEAHIAIKKRSNGGGIGNVVGCCDNFPLIKKKRKTFVKIVPSSSVETVPEKNENTNVELFGKIDAKMVDNWEELLDYI